MLPRELLNKYRVLKQMHHGIGGDIWLAEHIALGGKRVLKSIEKSHPQYDALTREAKILQQCQHPSIPIIYDILEFDTQTYIVEEFIEGENLKQYIVRQRSISASLLLEISMQLCEILIFLHNPARQILYLDLKPENILYTNHKLKLVDFGSAICLKQQKEERFIFGTPGYCAPEMKTMGKLSERTDLYCMGKCMEYMLFHTEGAPRGYRAVVERCLRQQKKEYASAAELYRELEKISHRKHKEKVKENWYAVTGVCSEEEAAVAALQLAMYLRERYNKAVLYLDCTKAHLMEHLELTGHHLENEGEQNSFVFERKKITVAKRVAPQEVGGWRNRGYAYIVVCLGKQSPLLSTCPFKKCIFAGAVTEFSLKEWQNMLLPVGKSQKTAVALTGGDVILAKREFGRNIRIGKLSSYFQAFETSKPFGRQMKRLLGGR